MEVPFSRNLNFTFKMTTHENAQILYQKGFKPTVEYILFTTYSVCEFGPLP